MMRLLFVALCAAFFPTTIGLAAQPNVPDEAEVLKAARLGKTHGDIVIVKEPVTPRSWKCTIYYATIERVRLPWGSIPAPRPRMQEIVLGQKVVGS